MIIGKYIFKDIIREQEYNNFIFFNKIFIKWRDMYFILFFIYVDILFKIIEIG